MTFERWLPRTDYSRREQILRRRLVASTPRSSGSPLLPGASAKQAELRKLAVAAVAAPQPTCVLEDDGLDDLSNSVLALTRAGGFEQALAACKRLLDEFPDVVDGLERSGLVHAKTGDHATAAAFCRQAYDVVTHPVGVTTTTAPITTGRGWKRRSSSPVCAEADHAQDAAAEHAR